MSADPQRQGRERVILIGTDPENPRGGIGVAISGFRTALESLGLFYTLIPSYNPNVRGRWFWPALKAAPKMLRAISTLKRSGLDPIVYSHAGAWPSLVREMFLLWLAHLAGARTMLHLKSPMVDEYLDHRLGRPLLDIGLGSVDLICVLTPWWKERLSSAGVAKPVVIVPNSIPAELEVVACAPVGGGSSSHRASGELRILSMARLVRGKGVDVVIEALVDLPNSYHCTIAGDGPERRRLEALASSLGVMARVTFAGWVSGEAKYHLLESADIFCLPSTRDSFGIVYIEAMAYGLPIVAVRSRGIPDVVLDGRTGYLVDAPEPLQVVEAVQKLADPKTREQMGSAGKLRVMEEFSSGILAGILRRVIDGLN